MNVGEGETGKRRRSEKKGEYISFLEIDPSDSTAGASTVPQAYQSSHPPEMLTMRWCEMCFRTLIAEDENHLTKGINQNPTLCDGMRCREPQNRLPRLSRLDYLFFPRDGRSRKRVPRIMDDRRKEDSSINSLS